MRCYLKIVALALAGTLLPLEHVQAHNLRTDSNQDKSPQNGNTQHNHGRHLRSRQLATPVGHGWAFGEDSKDEAAAIALTEQGKQAAAAAAVAAKEGDKATPIGHGWALGEDRKEQAAAAAVGQGNKATPIGHGWALGEDRKEQAVEGAKDEAVAGNVHTSMGHGWSYEGKDFVTAPAGDDKAVTPIAPGGWSLGEVSKQENEAAPAVAAIVGDKVATPMGHGWSVEGRAKDADFAFP